ncbi:arginine--tRNA ligase [Acidimicrobiaceae bacterium]|nr:arginine--tRNA ligase [Acidimicrobiaceae bacterium]
MIVGTKNIISDIKVVLKKYSIIELVELSYSQFENVDIQCNNLVKHAKNSNIEEIKRELKNTLSENEYIHKVSLAKNNFINIELSIKYFNENLNTEIKQINENKQSIIIDYGGPNIGKALHVGHLRTLNIGRSIYNTNKLAGNKIISDIHLGDWGMPVALILAFIEKNKIDINSVNYLDLESIYPDANNLAKSDEVFYENAKKIAKKLNNGDKLTLNNWRKIYKTSVTEIKKLLKEMGHSFDWFYGESDVVEETKKVIANAKIQKKVVDDSGALVSKEKHEPPIILIKSDGSFLYLTTDLGTIYFREEKQAFNKYLYVVDQRQSNHFKQLFSTVSYFGLSDKEFQHISYGTMNGVDNKPLKTRDGGVYKLTTLRDDIKNELKKKNSEENSLEILTNTILTYSDLIPNRTQNYKFEIDQFTETNGKTGIYIQYAQVRARKILESVPQVSYINFNGDLNEEERNLIFEISKFYYIFFNSLEKHEPHHLAEYAYTLSQVFNTFYTNNKILSEEISNPEREKRVYLVELFYQKILQVFEALGIEPVDKM